ncbi:hypothetical protein GCM10010446_64070 [Streptomyces enissocaesilis]|uniref:Uncharacterized protein n=1 Tax=Streptomyces enissocaesilis TaxID=332589 RepID=A0ABN3XMS1_9ACTN
MHTAPNGEATVRKTDDPITERTGLRWAFMGPLLTFALAGGDGGMLSPQAADGEARLPRPGRRLDRYALFRRGADAVPGQAPVGTE